MSKKKPKDGLTPMFRHYLEVKAEYPDAILLYRMGDFYETFFEDAEIAAPIFEIQLTARQKGTPSEAPMCGVPHHALDGYIGKLLAAGRKVAICDQVEDPKTAKGLVRREVTRVLTPGTVSELDLLEAGAFNHLLVLMTGASGLAGTLLDLSTGSFTGRRWSDADAVLGDLETWSVREVLLGPAIDQELGGNIRRKVNCVTELAADEVPSQKDAERDLRDQFGLDSLRGLGLADDDPVAVAGAVALGYVRRNSFSGVPHIRTLRFEADESSLVLDEATLRNLEILKNPTGRKHGSLLWVLDRTRTAGGGRTLRRWLTRPLRDLAAIDARLDAVEELGTPSVRQVLTDALRRIPDLERLTTRAVLGTMTPAECGAMRDGLRAVPEAQQTLVERRSDLLVEARSVDPCSDLEARLSAALSESPPNTIQNGGIFAEGYDDELDRLRSLSTDAKTMLLEIESRERAATGIGNLKVRFNRVFGYYLEVTKTHQDKVPEHYVRKQTLANAERYITEELKELESEILGAEEKQLAVEERLYRELREALAEEHERLMTLADTLARLDALASLAEVADRENYCRPRLLPAGSDLEIEQGRHPVVEKTVDRDFVANDAVLGDAARILLITGPNMGGKSTYLRQVALIALMAHCGSFVPAAKAAIPQLDRVFTRIGAADDLARGESTFMVEMTETANILLHATPDSLVVLDEVGRGTATFDGLSLAWAIVEHLHETVRAKTLFATHYHELTELAAMLPHLRNLSIAVREWRDQIVFLHRVVPGTADKSYGLHVGRLAGVPESVIQRAGEVLGNLEAQALDPQGKPKLGEGAQVAETAADQLRLFARPEDVVAQLLRELDLERLTPIAALNLLETLKGRLD